MVFDSVVFALTVYRSVALWRQGSRGLLHIVMRDGEFFSTSVFDWVFYLVDLRRGILYVSCALAIVIGVEFERPSSVLGFSTLSNTLTFLVRTPLCRHSLTHISTQFGSVSRAMAAVTRSERLNKME
jgi:hypothetical protein